MGILFSLFLFTLASNLDTLILAMAWGMREGRLSALSGLVIAAVTTVVTYLSLLVGRWAGDCFAQKTANTLGAALLVAMGIWCLLDWLRRLDQAEAPPPPLPQGLLSCVPLGAALAVNNGGMGAAAGMAGLSPLLCAGANFAVTLLALPLGFRLGHRLSCSALGKYALPVSGAMLILLGALENCL